MKVDPKYDNLSQSQEVLNNKETKEPNANISNTNPNVKTKNNSYSGSKGKVLKKRDLKKQAKELNQQMQGRHVPPEIP